MDYRLAQVNIGRILAPMDSPKMADFVANLDRINALAERSEGFIWRFKDDNNNATSIRIFDDDFLIVNMSVWKNAEALYRYVYQSDHVAIFKRRAEWFEKMPEMHMALWYVRNDSTPTVTEAIDRLTYLRLNGESPYSFTFRSKFTVKDAVLFEAEG